MENNKKGTCPIQIVESKTSSYLRWMTLVKHIFPNGNGKDRNYAYFDNIVPFCRDRSLPIDNLESLVNGRSTSPIYDSDIIRNPTIEEIEIIKSILKENGYKLNLKTYQLIKIGNYGKCNKRNTIVRD